jgi:hypothetical protein
MQNTVTIVTVFFDINREEKGDGRTLAEYKEWIKNTLQLNCNLYVITEESFRDFFLENRPKQYPMELKIMDFKDSHYYKYYDRMKEICESDYYKNRIAYPTRVECVLPEYNVIQYSKFHYLKMAIDENPFQSELFFWMDAGASRFFQNMDVSKPFPGENGIKMLKMQKKIFFAQNRYDLYNYKIDENFVWKADNLIYGGMFGGDKEVLEEITAKVEKTFIEEMLNNNNVNNEQLALALVWKKNPTLFAVCCDMNNPMFLLKILCQKK